MLVSRFGSVANAMRLAGLNPNLGGRPAMEVPDEFPTAEEISEKRRKWEEDPMPYPDDYFDVGLIGLQQRR